MYRLLALLALAAPAAALDVQGIDQGICPGESITLAAVGGGGDYLSYTFQHNGANIEHSEVTLTQDTTYQVTELDGGTDTFTVTLLDSSKCCTGINANTGEIQPTGCTRVPSNLFRGTAFTATLISMPSVTEVGDYAFRNTTMTSISMPKVTLVGEGAFYLVNGLTEINMPEVTWVLEHAFNGGDPNEGYRGTLTKVTMPQAISIGNFAFMSHTITEVSIPQVSHIVEHAFYSNQLTEINMPQVSRIGEMAFLDNPLTQVNMPVPEYVGDDAFGLVAEDDVQPNPNLALTLVDTEKIAAKLCGDVFQTPHNVISVSMPDVTDIDDDAFQECTALTTVSMPNVTEIGDDAFQGCTALTTVSMPKVTEIDQRVFQGCTALTTVSMPKVTEIGDEAFQGCTALTTVSMPKVTEIDQRVFQGCTALTTVSMPKVTEIGDEAFQGCTALTTVSMPKVTEIGDDVFTNCPSLRLVHLPTLIDCVYEESAFDDRTIILHGDCASASVSQFNCLTLNHFSTLLPTQAFVEAAIGAGQAQAVADAWDAKGQTCSGSGA